MPSPLFLRVFVFLGVFCALASVEARGFRVEQIPNGFEIGCTTCHERFGGGPRTPFGRDVNRTLVNGDVDWQAICDLDSDGDGFTNGEELGDPDCGWSEGDPAPSDDFPSNPGEADSFPAADVAVTIEGPESAEAGEGIAYTVAAFNLGARSASEVRIDLLLPEGMTGVIPGDECGVNQQGVSCFLIEDLRPNFGSNLFFAVQVSAEADPGTYIVQARVRTSTPETDDENNLVSIETEVSASVSGPTFLRGDSNDDGQIGISDSMRLFSALFLGGDFPACREAADSNNDSRIDITDGIYVLSYLFLGGDDLPAPGPTSCGIDPDPVGGPGDLGCSQYLSCANNGGVQGNIKIPGEDGNPPDDDDEDEDDDDEDEDDD
ncbi:MAG: hypothetical protein VX254_09905, partial [Planctomycetota bacterium]|nr:hypothetical protein [Planctomycetota bacterium]